MSWKKIKDELPPLNQWVVGKRGYHRPFVFRIVDKKGVFTISSVCMDVDNNYRDPEKWAEIPGDE